MTTAQHSSFLNTQASGYKSPSIETTNTGENQFSIPTTTTTTTTTTSIPTNNIIVGGVGGVVGGGGVVGSGVVVGSNVGKEHTTVVVQGLVRSKSMTEPLRSSTSVTGTRNSITPTPTLTTSTSTPASAASVVASTKSVVTSVEKVKSNTATNANGASAGATGGPNSAAATTTNTANTANTATATTTPNTTGVGQVSDMNELLSSIEDIVIDSIGAIFVNVPADVVGRMIGKHGTVVKELQLQSGASINIAKDGENYRVAQLTGSPAEIRLSACLLVQKFTPSENTAKHKTLDRLITHYRAISNRPQRAYVVESITVPTEAMGRIIGKGGATLRDLQDQSFAKIDLPRSTGYEEPKKVLTISGSASEVATCRQLLHQVINQPTYHFMDESDMYYQGAISDYDYMQSGYFPGYGFVTPQYQYVPSPQFGYVDPYYMMQYGNGSPPTASQMQMQMGFYPQPTPDQLAASMSRVSMADSSFDSDGGGMIPDMMMPPPSHQHQHQHPHPHALLPHPPPLSPHLPTHHQQHSQQQQQQQQQSPHHTQPLLSPQMHASMPMPPHSPHMNHTAATAATTNTTNNNNSPSSRPMAELIVCIPGDMVGRLIGRQGVTVKQLQADTHCRIDVLDPIGNIQNPIRYVRVTAAKMENVRMCEAQIHARVSFLRAHPGE